MTAANAFWLMSAVMQSAAAVMGLGLAAYVFVWQLFDDEAAPDHQRAGEVADLNKRIRAHLHRHFSLILGLLSGSVIASASAMLGFPKQELTLCPYQTVLMWLSVALLVAGVLWTTYLGWRVLVADVRHQMAQRFTRDVPGRRREGHEPDAVGTAGAFLNAYLPVETTLRSLAAKASIDDPRAPLRRIVEMLVDKELVPNDLLSDIEELVRYRNLVVHGEVDSIPGSAIAWASEIARRLGEE